MANVSSSSHPREHITSELALATFRHLCTQSPAVLASPSRITSLIPSNKALLRRPPPSYCPALLPSVPKSPTPTCCSLDGRRSSPTTRLSRMPTTSPPRPCPPPTNLIQTHSRARSSPTNSSPPSSTPGSSPRRGRQPRITYATCSNTGARRRSRTTRRIWQTTQTGQTPTR